MTKKPYIHNKKYILYRKGKVFSKYTNEYVESIATSGHPIINIQKGKNQTEGFGHVQVKMLIATAFVENPENLPSVININGIKKDCRAANLKWVSQTTALRIAQLPKTKKRATSKKRSADTRATKSIQTRGTAHYKFKGHYCKSGAMYITLAEAKKGSGEKIYQIKQHLQNGTGGWSFVARNEQTPKQGSSTFTSDHRHPEASF